MAAAATQTIVMKMPDWVPVAARNYLVHTEAGVSIRAIARASDCHASTILRQVRRFENRRDDPLVDEALRALSQTVSFPMPQTGGPMSHPLSIDLRHVPQADSDGMTEARIEKEALRVLRRLCENGAVLAAAREMDMAVVVRDAGDGSSTRTAVVDKAIAQAMALRDWISFSDGPARIARYHVINAGRAVLKTAYGRIREPRADPGQGRAGQR